jgi:DNA polymerase-3 subunit delta'
VTALAAMAASSGGAVGRLAGTLDAARRGGRLGHAYLVFGPTGAGKRALARALAADLLGHVRADGSHPDLLVLAPLEGKREIGIDLVRAATEELALAPLEAPGRVAIVEGADLLGEEAANALLKTLEEPPPGTTLLLTTSRPEAVLPTIRSRCMGLRLPGSGRSAGSGEIAAGADALLSTAGDPFERAARCWAACERAATEADDAAAASAPAEGPAATPLEKKRRAVLAAIDAATAIVAERFRSRARRGEPALAEAAAIERLAAAVEQIEANATPQLVLEVLAVDLVEGRVGRRVPRR